MDLQGPPFSRLIIAYEFAPTCTRAKIRVRLNRIRLGNFGDCKSVGGGVSELRIPHGPGYRVYFGRKDNMVVILLYGGDKKTQSRDIELAQTYWDDYLRRIR